ncbi:hypothetical protein EYF80_048072 [Liparis tanakae]|uniref:Uncharacterized protein n=1 Tax=Liparis tanakae TaxID=230148 RepID=A0A4Z2FLU8_9TELE|nr:hypothetical protein EYF80_048072 [Liparis tanakae]
MVVERQQHGHDFHDQPHQRRAGLNPQELRRKPEGAQIKPDLWTDVRSADTALCRHPNASPPAVSEEAFMDSPDHRIAALQTSTSNLNAGYTRPAEPEPEPAPPAPPVNDGKMSTDTIWLWVAVLATIGNIVVVAVTEGVCDPRSKVIVFTPESLAESLAVQSAAGLGGGQTQSCTVSTNKRRPKPLGGLREAIKHASPILSSGRISRRLAAAGEVRQEVRQEILDLRDGERHGRRSDPPRRGPGKEERSAREDRTVHVETLMCTWRQGCARGDRTVHVETELCTWRQDCARGNAAVHVETGLCT